jgi:hypothetical protein
MDDILKDWTDTAQQTAARFSVLTYTPMAFDSGNCCSPIEQAETDKRSAESLNKYAKHLLDRPLVWTKPRVRVKAISRRIER